jgi:hypothetical protein
MIQKSCLPGPKVYNPQSAPLSHNPYPTSTQPNTLSKIMETNDIFFFAVIIIVVLIIAIIIDAVVSFFALMSFITGRGLIVDVLYIVGPALKPYLRMAWSYKIPLPLLLLAVAATCGLTLVGQWYYSPLAYSCPAPWYERALSFLGGR